MTEITTRMKRNSLGRLRPVENKVKPRPRQRKAAEIMKDNIEKGLGKTDGQVLREAGYDESTAIHPTYVTESKGYKAALAQWGLTEELVTTALAEDIEKKPQRRVQELSLAADILSMRKRQEEKTAINIAIFTTEQQQRIAARIIEHRE